MKVIIVRHGQTGDNVRKVIAGQGIDSVLNVEGIEQAKKIAKYLGSEKIDVAYVSDQTRAVQTLEHILEFHPSVVVTKDKSLRERHYGELEGQPSHTAKDAAKESGLPYHLFRPKGGESHADVHKRIGDFFKTLFKKHKDQTVLIVSHGRAISLLLVGILDKPLDEEHQEAHRPENTGLTILEIFEGKPPKVLTLNSLEHLN